VVTSETCAYHKANLPANPHFPTRVCTPWAPSIRCASRRTLTSSRTSFLDQAPRYLLRDRDQAFHAWTTMATAMDNQDVLTAPHSPWQNAYVGRFIGSARRECLDHVLVFSATGLQWLMKLYCAY
jgi:transposase InsO family protein